MSEIHNIISSLCERHRLVFWFDPEGHYQEDYEAIKLPDVKKTSEELHPFKLKYQLLKQEPEQHFLIYQQKAKPPDEHNWLLDLMLRNTVFQADDASLLIAELDLPEALKPWIQKHLTFFRSKKRRETISRHKQHIQTPEHLLKHMLATIWNCEPDPFQILLHSILLHEQDIKTWESTTTYGLTEYYQQLVRRYFELPADATIEDPEALLIYLFRHPERLTCKIFLEQWRQHRSYFEQYRTLSQRIYEDVIAPSLATRETLSGTDLYEVEEAMLIEQLCQHILKRKHLTILSEQLAAAPNRFWYSFYEHPYEALSYAHQILQKLDALNPQPYDLKGCLTAYAEDQYNIDLDYRKFCWHYAQSTTSEYFDELKDLVDRRYELEYLEPINQHLADRIEQAPQQFLQSINQPALWSLYLQPILNKGQKLALIISDGLRYEIGKELEQRLNQENRLHAEMTMTVAQIPTFTQIGMASLLPTGKLTLDTKGQVKHKERSTAGTSNRARIYAEAVPDTQCYATQEFLKWTTKEAREETAGCQLLVLYSNTIDATGDDRKTEQNTFTAAENELVHLTEVIKQANNCNFSQCFVTADHGFLYRDHEAQQHEKILEYEKLAKSKTNRRFILTSKAPDDKRLLCFAPESLPYETEIHVCFPKALNVFKVSGAGTRYLHGGLSIQELAIPFLSVKKERSADYDTRPVALEITSLMRKLTSFTPVVKILQKEPVGNKVLPHEVRMGFYDQEGKELSNIVEHTFQQQDQEIRTRESAFRFSLMNEVVNYYHQQIYFKINSRYKQTSEYVDYVTQPVEALLTDNKDFEI